LFSSFARERFGLRPRRAAGFFTSAAGAVQGVLDGFPVEVGPPPSASFLISVPEKIHPWPGGYSRRLPVLDKNIAVFQKPFQFTYIAGPGMGHEQT